MERDRAAETLSRVTGLIWSKTSNERQSAYPLGAESLTLTVH